MLKLSIGLLEHQDIDLKGAEPPAFLEVEDSDMIAFKQDVHYSLHASMVSGNVLVRGTAATVADCVCGRCLKNYQQTVGNDDICLFYEQITEQELDIAEDVRVEVALNIPVNCICDPDCKGFCRKCGANLNDTACDCDQTNSEGNHWNALDQLEL